MNLIGARGEHLPTIMPYRRAGEASLISSTFYSEPQCTPMHGWYVCGYDSYRGLAAMTNYLPVVVRESARSLTAVEDFTTFQSPVTEAHGRL